MTESNAYVFLGTMLQFIVYLGVAPGVVGLLRWLKGRLQGRAAASPLQPYRDLWKLFHRRPVIPQDASWVFLSAPPIILGCYMLLGLLVPTVMLVSGETASSEITPLTVSAALTDPLKQLKSMLNEPPVTDLLGVIFLIGLARFAAGLAGLDANSAFGGLGCGREMSFHVLAEPTLLMIVYGLALKTRTSGMLWLIERQQKFEIDLIPAYLGGFLLAFALSLVLLSEAGRIPFDNPATHLELTMSVKAIHLEYGGPLLGMLELAEALRLTFFMTLLINLFVPVNLESQLPIIWQWLLQIMVYWLILSLLLIALALWELSRGKLGLRAGIGPAFLALAIALAGVIILAMWGAQSG